MNLKDKSFKNRVNPRKLLLSKWTAVTIAFKEKHFIVTNVNFDENSPGIVGSIQIEAILSHNIKLMSWKELKDKSKWLQGWV